jgi:hypothetical protein
MNNLSIFPWTLQELIIPFVIALIVFVLLFLLFREVNCWYWKINYRARLQEGIYENTRDIRKLLLDYFKKEEKGEAISNNPGSLEENKGHERKN